MTEPIAAVDAVAVRTSRGFGLAFTVGGWVSLGGGRGTVFGAIILVALVLSRITSGRNQK